ncbi:PhnA domain-containing protein [Motiliproteus sediminis]|uniref:PhnA domain-containing protein n=1 Tax=Motiliproteus sediminis TaxID=1468178 RepID=UPI001AF00E3C|nr:alkylphosphonate utilization protein [Motiliproteus sediminis]
MSIEATLQQRSAGKCELCGATDNLAAFEVTPSDSSAEQSALLCGTCRGQLDQSSELTPHHWHCLNDSMWSPTPAVQVLAWRMLKRLSGETWAQNALDMLYLEDDVRSWAEAGVAAGDDDAVVHLDCHGNRLEAGDTVTLIKDLDVKGASFTAKRGTAVRGISLVQDNPEHIEGRVNGQRIVILTKFVKKS